MKKYPISLSRRKFIQRVATVAVTTPFIIRCSTKTRSVNGILNHACIGVGGMGWSDLLKFKEDPNVQIVALCDVDEDRLKKASEALPDARTYTDWREMFKMEGDNIDSVNVSVPDHNHFPISLQAIRKRKHVYCQKPMCHDVNEVHSLTETSVKSGVITQLGTQLAANIGSQIAVQLIKDAAIGKIKHVYTHTCGSIGDRLELMRESNTSGLECLDPPPLGNVDLEIAFDQIGNDMFIKGNIDSVNSLLYADDEKAEIDVVKIIETGKTKGKGFILSTACYIAPMVSKERLLMLSQMVEKYGQY